MSGASNAHRSESSANSPSESLEICVCESGPGQLVFIEDGNADAWIATDTAVEPNP